MYNPQLETFIVVADMGSFNKAAEALYITPPAVTKQINLLENNLGLQLFNRTHRGADPDRSREQTSILWAGSLMRLCSNSDSAQEWNCLARESAQRFL